MAKLKFILLAILIFILPTAVHAETSSVMKISYNGEVKEAKDIGKGKGINIELPELDNENFYIYGIELAIFERQENETEWHIYTDEKGKQSKKIYIENPDSLNVMVDFGDLEDYRDRAKYKIAYRYHVRSIDDMSNIVIAGEDKKDGWRMVGEVNPAKATEQGFMFYMNSNPELEIESFSYTKHGKDGDKTATITPAELSEIRLPNDAFKNGVGVNCTVTDFDTEDILTVKYKLLNAKTEKELASGTLGSSSNIKANIECDKVVLVLIAYDNFGTESEEHSFVMNIDTEVPRVVNQFDDLGYVVMGNNLFSDFTINDDSSVPMTKGTVFATIKYGTEVVDSGYLEHIGKGIYRLDKTVDRDGQYSVQLDMFDDAGNYHNHTFVQTLDNTRPTIQFVYYTKNPNATKYSTWMNESKQIIIDTDDLSGVKKYKIYQGTKSVKYEILETPAKNFTISASVLNDRTGKLKYTGGIYDNAKAIDKNANCVDESSEGNRITFERYIWLDKTLPVIECDVNENTWYGTPAVFEAEFRDEPSVSGVDDVSGIKSKEYAVTDSQAIPSTWNEYSGEITIESGGVKYIHLKATDIAGNVKTVTKKVKVNTTSTIIGKVEPTSDYMHTIYYRGTDLYVIKNTAYNTKFHILINDADVNDEIAVRAKLTSQDNASVFAVSAPHSYHTGNVARDVEFNVQYINKLTGKTLPDGVYDMYIDVYETKNDGETLLTHSGVKGCEVVIKRTTPPTPIISVNSGFVEIEYPDETVAPSLNNAYVKSKYKKQYKIVKDGYATSSYVDYTEPIPVDDMIITAIYTDIAGNTSVSTKRIFGEGPGGGTEIDATIEGNNTTVEESRSGNVYYIGTRREKQKGINSNIFNFIE